MSPRRYAANFMAVLLVAAFTSTIAAGTWQSARLVCRGYPSASCFAFDTAWVFCVLSLSLASAMFLPSRLGRADLKVTHGCIHKRPVVHPACYSQSARSYGACAGSCKCNGKTTTAGSGGADCKTKNTKGKYYCYTDVEACSDGMATSKVFLSEFSYAACAKYHDQGLERATQSPPPPSPYRPAITSPSPPSPSSSTAQCQRFDYPVAMVPNRYCDEEIQSYAKVGDAAAACRARSDCVAVADESCGGFSTSGAFVTCKSVRSSTAGSCIYQKDCEPEDKCAGQLVQGMGKKQDVSKGKIQSQLSRDRNCGYESGRSPRAIKSNVQKQCPLRVKNDIDLVDILKVFGPDETLGNIIFEIIRCIGSVVEWFFGLFTGDDVPIQCSGVWKQIKTALEEIASTFFECTGTLTHDIGRFMPPIP